MREIYRPIHSCYETLRRRPDARRREANFNRRTFPANEQMTALGFAAASSRQTLFEQGYSR